MPRRVRRALLVALAALAGCSLAAGPDGGACINSCYCRSSGSTAPPEPSPPSRGPRTLLGAARVPPADNCRRCTVDVAVYSSDACSTEDGVMNTVTGQWMGGDHIIHVENSLLGYDPCPNTTKRLTIQGMVYVDGVINSAYKVDRLEGGVIDISKENQACRPACD